MSTLENEIETPDVIAHIQAQIALAIDSAREEGVSASRLARAIVSSLEAKGVPIPSVRRGSGYSFAHEIDTFFDAYQSGEFCDIDFGVALSLDVYRLYVDWCDRQRLVAAGINRFVERLVSEHRVISVRKRYTYMGETVGPHQLSILGRFKNPIRGHEASDLGIRIAGFSALVRGRVKQTEEAARRKSKAAHAAQ